MAFELEQPPGIYFRYTGEFVLGVEVLESVGGETFRGDLSNVG